MPVFNERDFLPATLAALARQRAAFRLVLVDNGSDDGSAALGRRLIAELGMTGRVLAEPRPGPVAATARGLAEVETEFVATCDADTYYPPNYLTTAERLLDADPGATMASAYYRPPDCSKPRAAAAALHQLGAALLWPRQAHNGAAGQCFRTAAMRTRGGYGAELWPHVLADQEIVHRMVKTGRQLWHRRHWCAPSRRRANAAAVRWTLAERLLYHFTPFARKDWFFYDFLGPRLAGRGLDSARLRRRD